MGVGKVWLRQYKVCKACIAPNDDLRETRGKGLKRAQGRASRELVVAWRTGNLATPGDSIALNRLGAIGLSEAWRKVPVLR